jgi:hypothetical protein
MQELFRVEVVWWFGGAAEGDAPQPDSVYMKVGASAHNSTTSSSLRVLVEFLLWETEWCVVTIVVRVCGWCTSIRSKLK